MTMEEELRIARMAAESEAEGLNEWRRAAMTARADLARLETEAAGLRDALETWAIPALDQCRLHFETCAGLVDRDRDSAPGWLITHLDKCRDSLAEDSARGAVVLTAEEAKFVLAFLPDPQPHMGWGNVDPLNSARAKLQAALGRGAEGRG